jgi:hypothetical protein
LEVFRRTDVGSNNTKNEQKMKKLILLFSIFILSCSSKSDEIDRIEIMSYYYNLNENQTKFKTELLAYSTIDKDGNVETIQKTHFAKEEFSNFQSKIDRNLIDKISIENKNRGDEFYKDKFKNDVVEIYDGPIIRIRIKYINQKEITFNSSDYKTNSKHKYFTELRKLIRDNYSEKKFKQIENPTELEKKLKDFEKYSLNKDTLELPFPPMPMPVPKNEQIKFTK